MLSSDIMRGYNDLFILSILLDHDSYGYEISKAIRKISEEKYIMKETTLYSAFNRLEKKTYIISYPGEETHGKKRTYYKITELGRNYYHEKCDEWQITKEVVDQFIRSGTNEHN